MPTTCPSGKVTASLLLNKGLKFCVRAYSNNYLFVAQDFQFTNSSAFTIVRGKVSIAKIVLIFQMNKLAVRRSYLKRFPVQDLQIRNTLLNKSSSKMHVYVRLKFYSMKQAIGQQPKPIVEMSRTWFRFWDFRKYKCAIADTRTGGDFLK
ncbi:hypothetical protein BY458DRAFT_489363 [Sporodiniella umbellata]|nr:hypothetical protein BY458DRAFT_489363 [Sporodiniella umbellata]